MPVLPWLFTPSCTPILPRDGPGKPRWHYGTRNSNKRPSWYRTPTATSPNTNSLTSTPKKSKCKSLKKKTPEIPGFFYELLIFLVPVAGTKVDHYILYQCHNGCQSCNHIGCCR